MQEAPDNARERPEMIAPGERTPQILYRVGQFFRQLDPRADREVDGALSALLTPDQYTLLTWLTPADRHHLLSVHRALVHDGWTDTDLLTAAILHDAGKADESGRVTLIHRVANVLLSAFAPGLLSRLALEPGGWIRHGLYLSVHHAEIGAERARRAGVSEHACWLIAHHDDDRIGGDPALRALREKDARE